MIAEFLGSLLEVGIIFLIIFTFISGYFVGWAYLGGVGNTLWFIALVFLQGMILYSVDYVEVLLYIMTTGASDGMARSVLLMHEIMHPSLLVLWMMLGRHLKRSDAEERQTAANSLTPEFYKADLDVLGAYPELAVAGWFEARWNRMDGVQRLQWVTANISELRRVWVDGDTNGFEKHGTNLPAMLAKVDGAAVSNNDRAPGLIEPEEVVEKWDDDAMGAQLFFVQFNLLSGDPKFADAGWFKERWVIMDGDTKLAWVEHNIGSLRQIWNQGDDVGLVRHGFGLSHTLAQLDLVMLTAKLGILIQEKESQ